MVTGLNNDWKEEPLSTYVDVKGGNGFPLRFQEKESDIAFLKVSDLGERDGQKSLVKAHHFISKKSNEALKAKIYPAKSIIFAKIGAAVFLERKRILSFNACIDNNLAVVLPSSNIDVDFLYYLLANYNISDHVTATALPSINIKDFLSSTHRFPEIPEQQAIAKALSDIDDLIETLLKEENKHRCIKEGLLGQIDKRFSGTTLLKNCVSSPVTDGPHLTPVFYTSGVPFLSVNNIVDNKIVWENLRYISPSDDLEFSRKCKPRKNDILFGKAASVGKVAIVDKDTDFNVWSPLAVIRVNEKYDPYFIYFCFQTKTVMNQILFLTNSSSQGNIGMGDIENINLPILDKSEQTRLGNLLRDEDTYIDGLSKLRSKYERIKQGMAHDLLTGRVRLV